MSMQCNTVHSWRYNDDDGTNDDEGLVLGNDDDDGATYGMHSLNETATEVVDLG